MIEVYTPKVYKQRKGFIYIEVTKCGQLQPFIYVRYPFKETNQPSKFQVFLLISDLHHC